MNFWESLVHDAVWSLSFGLVGLVLFGLAFWVMNRASGLSMKKELLEDQNTALAIVIASVVIGIAMIVSSVVG